MPAFPPNLHRIHRGRGGALFLAAAGTSLRLAQLWTLNTKGGKHEGGGEGAGASPSQLLPREEGQNGGASFPMADPCGGGGSCW